MQSSAIESVNEVCFDPRLNGIYHCVGLEVNTILPSALSVHVVHSSFLTEVVRSCV